MDRILTGLLNLLSNHFQSQPAEGAFNKMCTVRSGWGIDSVDLLPFCCSSAEEGSAE